MLRREIRYALGRCKTGNPDPQHLAVLEKYQPQLDDFGVTIQQFMVDWDIHTTNLDQLIFGPQVKKSLEEYLPTGPEVKMSYIMDLGDIPFAAPVKTVTDEVTLDAPTAQELSDFEASAAAVEAEAEKPTKKKKSR